MKNIHPTAIVSPKADLADDVSVGPFAIIEDGVIIGKGTKIDSSVLLATGAIIGENVKISHGAVIGTFPQDLKFKGEETKAIIGDRTVIREYVTVNRGTTYSYQSKIGKDCLLMAYSHVAHDCIVGDNVIIGNCSALAGHIEVDSYAILSGLIPVHQFVKIGTHSMVGGGFRVPQDICPYALMAGYPLKTVGVNKVGLKRRGFSPEALNTIEKAFKFLFFSGLNTTQAVERIKNDMDITPEIQVIFDFMERSKRGLTK
ncbi:MAG: acyl-ACP--UDP-N-acetylglucosamine O-acyltransferase [Candidatus Zixiibacteriota bacterium]